MSAGKLASSDYAIVAVEASADEQTHVLKAADTFAVLDRHGDIRAGGLGQLGLYSQGTRRLSRFELSIAGRKPLLLGSTITADNSASVVDLTNPDIFSEDGNSLRRETLHIHRVTVVSPSALHCQVEVQNYGLAPVRFDLDLALEADFVDLFEVRGSRRVGRGAYGERVTSDRLLRFSYRGLDDEERVTALRFDPAPQCFNEGGASWRLAVEPRGEATLTISVVCELGVAPASFSVARKAAIDVLQDSAAPLMRIGVSHDQFGACLRRAASDLAMMLTPTKQGLYPYAGVPWFCTPFGRDGIVTALELLWLHPPVAAGVLRYLAAHQATTGDPTRDAEPGKILHEARDGEMAILGEVPFGRYYGSVDATPLFVLLAGAYHRRTNDRRLIEALWPNIAAALDWIDRHGDPDGDGFVEYQRHSEHGLRHQGWKDSEDSVFDENGRLVEGPIALAEVQAYVYGAKVEGACLAEMLGEHAIASKLRTQATALRERFEAAFWCEELDAYALALDGAKRPCRVRTSNAGQCLLTGLVREDRALRVAAELLHPDLFSGWGIRTLSRDERRYNPISYHNGTVWPHDNALIAAGMARYGLTSYVMPIFEGLVEATRWLPLDRLPELFCGFARRTSQGPTLYPVACAPQAWAAGAPYLLLSSVLGLEIVAAEHRVVLRQPRMPPWLDHVMISGLEVGGRSVDLDLRRSGDTVSITPRTQSGVEVAKII